MADNFYGAGHSDLASAGQQAWAPAGDSGLSMPLSFLTGLAGSTNMTSTSAEFPPPNFSIQQIMAMPAFREMQANLQASSSLCAKLYEQNQVKDREIQRLKSELQNVLAAPSSPAALSGQDLVSHSSLQHSKSHSIAPSDSVSQQASELLTGRFSHISREAPPPGVDSARVLWYASDAKRDDSTRPSASNQGRYKMRHAIRTLDGTPVREEIYNAIRRESGNVAQRLIAAAERHGNRTKPTKKHLMKALPDAWRDEITAFELKYPVLQHCAASWKAEHLVTNSLTKRAGDKGPTGKKGSQHRRVSSLKARSKGKTKHVDDNGSDEDEDMLSDKEEMGGGSGDDLPSGNNTMNDAAAMEPPASEDGSSISASISEPATRNQVSSSNVVASRLADISAAALSLGGGRNANTNPTGPLNTESPPKVMALPGAIGPPRVNALDAIHVAASAESLRECFSRVEFQSISDGLALINMLDSLSLPPADPAISTLNFIHRIEDADPTATDLDEDDTNVGWGHRQFTAGGIRCSTVLMSWDTIGNVETAYRLIAAALKTCLVSRFLCQRSGITTSSYLSDAYLREVVEILTRLVKGQVSAMEVDHPPSESQVDAQSSVHTEQSSGQHAVQRPSLQSLHVPELMAWIKEKKLVQPPKDKKKKDDLIAHIHADPEKRFPTPQEIEDIISKRAASRKRK